MVLRLLRRVALLSTFAAISLLTSAAGAQTDPMLGSDFVDPATGIVAQLQPGVPWITAGADGKFGTSDDVVDFAVVGDIDIVLRTGLTSIAGSIPPTAPLDTRAVPVGIVGGVGTGVPIPFVVIASDGSSPPSTGLPVDPASLQDSPVLVVAFADLDDDGYVGITNLDGDPTDNEVEEAELDPVGRRFAFFDSGQAAGVLHVRAGLPLPANLTVVLTAAAFTGPRNPDFFGGEVPEGPVVLARFPFFPRTNPDDIVEGNIPEPASGDGLVGVDVADEFTPDPNDPYGESFTIPTDGSLPSVDIATVRSGSFESFGLLRPLDPAIVNSPMGATLRPGVDSAGNRILLETIDSFDIGAGPGDDSTLILLPLDEKSNVAQAPLLGNALLMASGGLSISSPDTDQDPLRESIHITSSSGVIIDLEGSGALLVETIPTPACGRGWSLAMLATLAVIRRPRRKRG